MDKESLLHKYLTGELTPQERLEFDSLLESDSDFREEVAFQTDVKRAVTAEEDDDFRAMLSDFESESTPRAPKSWRPRTPWLVAASLVLLVGLTYYIAMDSSAPRELASDYFSPYPNVVYAVERGETGAATETQAFATYASGRYAEALPLFEELYKEEQTPYLLFYRANTLLQLERAEEAIPMLRQFQTTNDSLAEKSTWYLALAYLQLEDVDQARNLLEQVVAENVFKVEEAKELLKRL